MKPTLQLKLTQQLKLTPQLQQSIRLLQLSTLELNQEIERIVQENPLLELRDDWSLSEANNSFESEESPDSVDLESASIERSESETDIVSEENSEPDFEWAVENVSAHNAFEDDDREALQVPDKPLSLR